MKSIIRSLIGAVVIGVAVLVTVPIHDAQADVYTVDSSLSSITVSGSVTLRNVKGTWSYDLCSILFSCPETGGFTITGGGLALQQGPGSLTTSLAGWVDTTKTGDTLTFNGASITATDNGIWKPKNEPGQLAGQFEQNVNINFTGGLLNGFFLNHFETFLTDTFIGNSVVGNMVQFAMRGLNLDVTGEATLDASGNFDGSNLSATKVGSIDYGSNGLVKHPFSLDLGGEIGTIGSGQYTGDTALTNFSFNDMFKKSVLVPYEDNYDGGILGVGAINGSGYLDFTLYLSGQVYFLTEVAPVPEPEIYAMLGVGLGLMGWVGRRRKLQAA